MKPLYFRPPYGSYNDLVLQVLGERGYKSEYSSQSVMSVNLTTVSELFLWSEDTQDASGASVQFSEGVMDGVINSAPQPHMVLSHSVVSTSKSLDMDVSESSTDPNILAAFDVVPYAAGRLQNAGYQLVSVDTCLGDAGEWPYEYVGQPGTPDGSWTC